jgi:hypothetical protein
MKMEITMTYNNLTTMIKICITLTNQYGKNTNIEINEELSKKKYSNEYLNDDSYNIFFEIKNKEK